MLFICIANYYYIVIESRSRKLYALIKTFFNFLNYIQSDSEASSSLRLRLTFFFASSYVFGVIMINNAYQNIYMYVKCQMSRKFLPLL